MFVVAFNGAEAAGGSSAPDAVWTDRGNVAGEPHPERVAACFLPCAAGDALLGRRTGECCTCSQAQSFVCLFLDVWCTILLCVQVKSVKPCLKQLQQCIQTISTLHDDEILPSNSADLFHWLPKEHMCVLVYLVSDFHY